VQFFTGLELKKSWANALLNQLSADWSEQYEVIAKLLAMQWVIYIDETSILKPFDNLYCGWSQWLNQWFIHPFKLTPFFSVLVRAISCAIAPATLKSKSVRFLRKC
jgi:hypothetical protein